MIRLLIAVMSLMSIAIPTLAQTPAIWLEPDSLYQQNNPSQPVILDVICDNELIDMKGVHLVLSCNPSILVFDTQATRLGNMFVAHDTVTFFAELTGNGGAEITIDIAVLGGSVTVNGPGILAKAGMRVNGPNFGVSDITIQECTVRNHLNEDIPVTVTDGWVRICQFVGDITADGIIDISDLTKLVNYLFVFPAQNPPTPLAAGDTTCDGVVDISDLVLLVKYLFLDGPGFCGPCLD